MEEVVRAAGAVEVEAALPEADGWDDFCGHPVVAPHQIRVVRLVVLEGNHPVRTGGSLLRGARELVMSHRIRHLCRQLPGQLAPAVFREARLSNLPRLSLVLPRDDADPDPKRNPRLRGGLVLIELGIFDSSRSDRPRGGEARLRRSGDENAWKQLDG